MRDPVPQRLPRLQEDRSSGVRPHIADGFMSYSDHYSDVASTTIQLERSTHGRLKRVRHEMTFDELINLMLDLVTPQEIEQARALRRKAYEHWQDNVAKKVRANRANKRLF